MTLEPSCIMGPGNEYTNSIALIKQIGLENEFLLLYNAVDNHS